MAGVVELMPLPDALPDRRIYELLKTVDLENLTFSDFQKVAQTIYAEQGAEDELRRIVLLNLARLSVAGEWTGLTSAGGASGSIAQLLDLNGWELQATGYETMPRNSLQAYVASADTQDYINIYATYYHFFPITIRGDGDYSSFSFWVHTFVSLSNVEGGFYDSDEYGRPRTKLATYSHEFTQAGADPVTVTETTTGSMTLSDGDNIWFVIKKGSFNNNVRIKTMLDTIQNMQGASYTTGADVGLPFNCLLSLNFPDTFAETDLTAVGEINNPLIYW